MQASLRIICCILKHNSVSCINILIAPKLSINIPVVSAPPAQRKITVAVIKPDAVAAEKVDEILAKVSQPLCNYGTSLYYVYL